MSGHPTTKRPYRDLLPSMYEQAAVRNQERDLEEYLAAIHRAAECEDLSKFKDLL